MRQGSIPATYAGSTTGATTTALLMLRVPSAVFSLDGVGGSDSVPK